MRFSRQKGGSASRVVSLGFPLMVLSRVITELVISVEKKIQGAVQSELASRDDLMEASVLRSGSRLI